VTAPRELVYGRHPVREVVRAGRREVLELLVSQRALETETWLQETTGLRLQIRPDAALGAASGTKDHQGVVAFCEPYRYADADELAAFHEPLLACLDGITDPQNLGAVCRSAEGAGATGVVLPERNAARVTAAVCRASAGAVEHLAVARVRNLADWLAGAKDAGAWIYGAEATAPALHTQADLTGRVVLVLGGEAKGLRRRISETCDLLVSIPARGKVASLNVSAAAAVLLFEALRQREGV
jgi:23S rRNA (guanosine2251-2'-O)-methyltransferase